MAEPCLNVGTVGERYRAIRLSYRHDANKELEVKRVKEAFSPNDQQKYWKLAAHHPSMRDALDSLLHLKCLWPDMRLSTLHKMFSLKCDELFVNYVRHIRSVWEYMLHDSETIAQVDHESVKIIETLCPGLSEDDKSIVHRSSIGKHLDNRQRHLFKRRLLRVDTLVPSFRTLFEDMNYLEMIVNTIKKLHRPKHLETSLYGSFRSLAPQSRSTSRAWRQLFLYSMRNYPRVHACPNRESDSHHIDNASTDIDEAQLVHFSSYASDIGFTNIWTSPVILPAGGNGYDVKETHPPDFVTNDRGRRVKGRRSGPPRKVVQQQARGYLWLQYMELPNKAVSKWITPALVQKAFYTALFGTWKPPTADFAADEVVLIEDPCDEGISTRSPRTDATDSNTYVDSQTLVTKNNFVSRSTPPTITIPNGFGDDQYNPSTSKATGNPLKRMRRESNDTFYSFRSPSPSALSVEPMSTGAGDWPDRPMSPVYAPTSLKRPLPSNSDHHGALDW